MPNRGTPRLGEDNTPHWPVVSFRISQAKKNYLVKYYGKLLPELIREQMDILIVRSLNLENK